MSHAAVNPTPAQHTALQRMKDGTLKQVNPFTGTHVWTVPGRGNRPLHPQPNEPAALGPGAHTDTCNFCADRMLHTPPERSRLVTTSTGFDILRNVMPDELDATQADFRRVPNLFEIVSYDYWRENYGAEMSKDWQEHMERYLSDPSGRHHVLDIVRTRLSASGQDPDLPDEQLLSIAPAYFGGGHDVIIARRPATPPTSQAQARSLRMSITSSSPSPSIRCTTSSLTTVTPAMLWCFKTGSPQPARPLNTCISSWLLSTSMASTLSPKSPSCSSTRTCTTTGV